MTYWYLSESNMRNTAFSFHFRGEHLSIKYTSVLKYMFESGTDNYLVISVKVFLLVLQQILHSLLMCIVKSRTKEKRAGEKIKKKKKNKEKINFTCTLSNISTSSSENK